MSDPLSAQRALIFTRREYPAAFKKLVETGETAQGMCLSTRSRVKWLLAGLVDFWARTFGAIPPRSRVFYATPSLGYKGPDFYTVCAPRSLPESKLE